MLELIIDKRNNIRTIMLLENGILIEKHEEHENQRRIEGNIYIGKVQSVLTGMQSAFIDIGEERAALIRLQDILPKQDTKSKHEDTKIDINKVIKAGNFIMVQIKKDGTTNKGAKASTHINLPGKYVVLMPDANFITISQKIEDEEEKDRLIKIAKENLPKNYGVILRTSSEGVEQEKIAEDIDSLVKTWTDIHEKNKNEKSIQMIYDNKALIRRTVLDLLSSDLKKIITNDTDTFNEIKGMLDKETNIELRKDIDLFDLYTLSNQIQKLSNRKIWLNCGGFITIDHTEALTAIDVNTGKYTGKKDIEKTIFTVNKEATTEIAKQLRLRDIGGIIIIDYIDMHIEENKGKIVELLKDALKKDRAKTQIAGFTKLNLLEMTRKNMCNNDYFNEGEN